MPWLMLFIAIVAEVIATSTLKSTEGFTRLWPSVVVVVAYETAFILLSLCLKKIPVGIVYAVWSGVGVALVTLVAWFFLDQPLDAPAIAGLGLRAATDLFQRQLIEQTLTVHDGNWAATARALDLDGGNLHRLARRLGLKA